MKGQSQAYDYSQNQAPLAVPVMKGQQDGAYTTHPAVPNVQSMRPAEPVASTGWRDLPFAIAFILVALATIGVAFGFGIPAMTESKSDLFEDAGSISHFLYTGLVMCVIAAVLAFAMVKMMVAHAKGMIKFALFFQIGFTAVAMLGAFAAGAMVLGVIGLIFLLLGICYFYLVRHRIPFASANLKVAAAAIQAHTSTHAVAFLFLFVQIVWTLLWSIAVIGVVDATNQNHTRASDQRGDRYNGYGCTVSEDCQSGYCSSGTCAPAPAATVSPLIYVLLLAFYWAVSIFRNVTHCTVIGTVATWWYSPSASVGPAGASGATGASLRRALTTSFGSICLGSLLVAIIQTLRALAASARSRGSVVACLAECLLACLARLIEYFNRWAYVYVGIYGYPYLKAGKAVLSLFKSRGFDAIINDNLIQNALSLAALGVGLLCAAAGVGLYYLQPDVYAVGSSSGGSSSDSSTATAASAVLLGLIGFLIGFGIATIPLSVIDSGVATVFVCFAEDPSVFAATHPTLYAPLVTEWHRVYPDVVTANGYYYA